MLYGFVYITTNSINGMRYIGKKKIARKDSLTYLGSGKRLRNAMNVYGKTNFYRDIVDYAVSEEHLNTLEKHYIEIYNAQESENFYNISSGGDWGDVTKGMSNDELEWYKEKISIGIKRAYRNNPELRVVQSERMKKRAMSEEHIDKLSRARAKQKLNMSEEQKRKRRRMNDMKHALGINPKNPWLHQQHPWTGRKHSDITKSKISDALIGVFNGDKNPMYGKTHTNNSKLLMSEKRVAYWKNNPTSEELKKSYRDRYSVEYLGEGNPNFGNRWTDEQKKAMSKKLIETGANKGKNNPMYGKKGKNAINGQKVYMLNDNHEIVKEFPSVVEVQKFLKVKAHSGLNKACREGIKYHNYYWKKEFKKINAKG